MRSILFSLTLITTVLSISTRIHRNQHQVTEQCCAQKGGTVCGNVIKDCCTQGCYQGVMKSQWCQNHSKIIPVCPTCMNICEQKGGVACQVSADSGEISCCPSAKCVKVNNGTQSSSFLVTLLTNIAKGVVSSLAGGALAGAIGSHQHHQLADQLIQKILGPSNYCQAGSQIDLGSCQSDSFIDLVQKKALG